MFDEVIIPFLTTHWGRRAGWGVVGGMILLLIITFFESLSDWRQDFSLTKIQDHKSSNLPVNDEALTAMIQIPAQHLFGDAHSQQHNILPITSLQLRLLGVIIGYSEKFSHVIISRGDQHGKVYYIGDNLISGVKVHAITHDGVILDNGERLEKLPLQRVSLSFHGIPQSLPQEDVQEG